jgi:RimJ/RimL family protein N-acetyltransferase
LKERRLNLLSDYLPLTTKRFELRYFLESEIEWLFKLECNEDVKQFVGSGPYRGPRDQWFSRIRSAISNGIMVDDYALGIVRRDTGNLIGTCGIHEDVIDSSWTGRSRTGEFDLRVVLLPREDENMRARGVEIAYELMRVAFGCLEAKIFVATVDARNRGARKLAESLGFSTDWRDFEHQVSSNIRYEIDLSTWRAMQ